jgi:hypothetical protein
MKDKYTFSESTHSKVQTSIARFPPEASPPWTSFPTDTDTHTDTHTHTHTHTHTQWHAHSTTYKGIVDAPMRVTPEFLSMTMG